MQLSFYKHNTSISNSLIDVYRSSSSRVKSGNNFAFIGHDSVESWQEMRAEKQVGNKARLEPEKMFPPGAKGFIMSYASDDYWVRLNKQKTLLPAVVLHLVHYHDHLMQTSLHRWPQYGHYSIKAAFFFIMLDRKWVGERTSERSTPESVTVMYFFLFFKRVRPWPQEHSGAFFKRWPVVQCWPHVALLWKLPLSLSLCSLTCSFTVLRK